MSRRSLIAVTMLILAGLFISGNEAIAQVNPSRAKTTEKEAKPAKTKGKTKKPKPDKPQNTNLESTSVTKPPVPVVSGSTAASAEPAGYQPIVDQKPNGKVDWTNQYIEAKGQSVIDTIRFKNKAQARAMARRGAIVDAQRNLLEIVQGVQVTSETKVKDLIAESDFILTRVDGVIKNAEVQNEGVEKDGLMEITMRIPLYQTNGLAPIMAEAVNKDKSAAAPTPGGLPEKNLPASSGVDQTNAGPLDELVFDFKGKSFDPSMFPVIVDENNNILLDMSKIYDPKTGKFPKIVSASKELFKSMDFKEGKQIVEVIDSFNGKIKIDNGKLLGKVNWGKVGKVAGTVGKFLMTLLIL